MGVEWLSKRQRTVKYTTYGAELVSGCTAVDQLVALRNDFWLLGSLWTHHLFSLVAKKLWFLITLALNKSSRNVITHSHTSLPPLLQGNCSWDCYFICSTHKNKADIFTKAFGQNAFECLIHASFGQPTTHSPSEPSSPSIDHRELQKVVQHLKWTANQLWK